MSGARGRKAPAEPEKGSRKEELAALAVSLMQSRGFSAFGLREFAEAAGMRPPSLYNHFASKDALGRSALALYAREHRAGLERLDGLPSGGARVRAYAERCGECLHQDGHFCLFLMLTTSSHDLSPDAVGDIAAFVEEQMGWLARAWDLGRADGSIRSDQAGEAMGPVVFGALRGMMAFAILKANPAAVFSAQREAFLRALGVS